MPCSQNPLQTSVPRRTRETRIHHLSSFKELLKWQKLDGDIKLLDSGNALGESGSASRISVESVVMLASRRQLEKGHAALALKILDAYVGSSALEGDNPSWTLYMQIMPFEEAETYRFNPFDLTKVWPHGDYPLIEVGRMTLDRNPTDHHTEIEQAAFEPNNLVPGVGPSPDKMLLARMFSYADAHRARLGGNYKQIPVNSANVPVHSYSKDGSMRVSKVSDPVYAPNSYGGPEADRNQSGEPPGWYTSGQIVQDAYTKRRDDDDFGQAGTMVREVMDDAARARLVSNVAGHLLDGVTEPVLKRAFEYWRNIDNDIGERIERAVKNNGNS